MSGEPKIDWPEIEEIEEKKRGLNERLRDHFYGREAIAVPSNHSQKFPPRRCVVSDAFVSRGEILLSFDWFKKDGTGEFHDSLPVWARKYYPLSHVQEWTGRRVMTESERRLKKGREGGAA
jgi:hypothetical protein